MDSYKSIFGQDFFYAFQLSANQDFTVILIVDYLRVVPFCFTPDYFVYKKELMALHGGDGDSIILIISDFFKRKLFFA